MLYFLRSRSRAIASGWLIGCGRGHSNRGGALRLLSEELGDEAYFIIGHVEELLS
jgi:hypothetical protein